MRAHADMEVAFIVIKQAKQAATGCQQVHKWGLLRPEDVAIWHLNGKYSIFQNIRAGQWKAALNFWGITLNTKRKDASSSFTSPKNKMCILLP